MSTLPTSNNWTSGVRDDHTLWSDYLTANSVFLAALGFLLARQPSTLLFTLLVILFCTFGIMRALQMAIVLGRFSAQNALREWQLRGIEQTPGWTQEKLFLGLHRFLDLHEWLQDRANDPAMFPANWAIRQQRQWRVRHEISFPTFFGIAYGLFLLWAVAQLGG